MEILSDAVFHGRITSNNLIHLTNSLDGKLIVGNAFIHNTEIGLYAEGADPLDGLQNSVVGLTRHHLNILTSNGSRAHIEYPKLGPGTTTQFATTNHYPRKLNDRLGNLGLFQMVSPIVPEGCKIFTMVGETDNEHLRIRKFLHSFACASPFLIQFNYCSLNSDRLADFPVLEYWISKCSSDVGVADLVVSRSETNQVGIGHFKANILVASTEFLVGTNWRVWGT